MFRNYCKIVYRHLWKDKVSTAINTGGLAVGLASFIIILLYLHYELSFDKWDGQLKQVYRVSMQTEHRFEGNPAPAPLAPLLQEHVPEIAAFTRITPAGDEEILMSAGNKKVYQPNLVMADTGFLQVFPYRLAVGNLKTALAAPGSALITMDVAKKLFGDANPLGQTITLYNQLKCTVTGILQTPGTPSHLKVDVLVRDPWLATNSSWENYSYTTYILTRKPVPARQLEERLNKVFAANHDGKGATLTVDAVTDIHNFPRHGESHFRTTMTLFLLAVLLLLSGAINSNNLSLVRCLKRSRETGVRKVLGSSRTQIMLQFLLEVSLQCLAALVLAAVMVVIGLPLFNSTFNTALSLQQYAAPSMLLQMGLSLLAVMLLSGLYPAFVFSGFGAAKALKGNYASGVKGKRFSYSLITAQFAVSAFFIICVLVIARQIQYMRHRDIGFNPSQVIKIEAMQKTREDNFQATRIKLLQVPGVAYVSKSTAIPGNRHIDTSTHRFRYGGHEYAMTSVKVSTDYFVTMQIPLVAGRLFSDDHPEDQDNTAIINETAARLLGGKEITGTEIRFPYCDSLPYRIVGVVKDFHVQGFNSYIKPTVYSISNAHCGYQSGGGLLVKVKTDHLDRTLKGITDTWASVEPDIPLRYTFLDQQFRQLFDSYTKLQGIISIFAFISVLISVMGLFALTAYTSEQRTREIGIRKVLGASVAGIVALLSKDFLRLALISVVLASPLAYYFLHRWLQDFAYRASISWHLFLLAGVMVVMITLLTAGYQATRAALVNPARSLRTE